MNLAKAKTFYWTQHSREKMRFYWLSESRVKRVLNSPKRIEEGVAPNTIALMQPASYKSSGKNPDWKQEIWTMVQDVGNRRKIISAWRYPGKTKPRSEITADFIRREYEEYSAS